MPWIYCSCGVELHYKSPSKALSLQERVEKQDKRREEGVRTLMEVSLKYCEYHLSACRGSKQTLRAYFSKNSLLFAVSCHAAT
jgi:hypothetical protein